jgi:hypothetical protein
MARRRALDQGVERGVNINAVQPAIEPGVLRVTDALPCLFE